MSFVCQKCHEPQPQHSKPIKKVTKWRTIRVEGLADRREIEREEDWCSRCMAQVDEQPS